MSTKAFEDIDPPKDDLCGIEPDSGSLKRDPSYVNRFAERGSTDFSLSFAVGSNRLKSLLLK